MIKIPLTAAALKYSLMANVALAVLLVAGVGYQQYRVQSAQLDTAKAVTELAELKAAIATEREAFEVKARELENAKAAAVIAVTDKYEKEKADAKQTHDAVVADLRAGNLKLRRHWQGYLATSQLSEAAAAAAVTDGSAGLRETGAGNLVRVGATCDARVNAMIGVIRALYEPAP